jgi:hypothetical protein
VQFDSGTVTATGQISSVSDRIHVIELHARSDNSNNCYVGVSDITMTNGRELEPGEAVKWDFGLMKQEATVPFNIFYVHLVGVDKVDWTVIKE